MASVLTLAAVVSSFVLRGAAYLFLRWIPGHHFPPIVVASLVVYLLSVVFTHKTSPNAKSNAVPETTRERANGVEQKNGPIPDKGNEVDDGEDIDPDEGYKTKEEAAADPDDPKMLQALLTGLPCSKIFFWNVATVLINLVLAFFVLDMVFNAPLSYPSEDLRFNRVGYVSSTSAHLLIREPDPAELPLFVFYRPELRASWTTADKIYHLSESTDFTAAITLADLKPSTKYIYSASNNLTGHFTTAPSLRSRQAGHLTFLTSSCIKANFPYSPISHALAIPGLSHLSNVLKSLPSPASFMLFLGDFIYIDVPLRMASTVAHYRSEYRRVYASPSWSLPGLSSLPWLHTLDDHEIANDWAGGNSTPPYPAASDPFWHYHVSVNPPLPPHSVPGNTTYFSFTQGPASFFMLDTRTYRTPPEPNPDATILGKVQLNSLLEFLSRPEPRSVKWKIIASSVPFTKNWRFGTSDTWGGFLAERSLVLDAMHAAERDLGVRIVILSGDRHEFGAIRFPPPPPSNASTSINTHGTSGPHEFSVGPLSMFYLPFRTFHQIDDKDVAIKYLPDGNSKVGVVDIDNIEGGHDGMSLLKYTLYIDGKVAWAYALTSPAPEFKGKGSILDAVWG